MLAVQPACFRAPAFRGGALDRERVLRRHNANTLAMPRYESNIMLSVPPFLWVQRGHVRAPQFHARVQQRGATNDRCSAAPIAPARQPIMVRFRRLRT
jgi:hypothetical protein